jgi:hypothetical protein
VGPLRVVLQGLAPTDRVVIGNLQRAIPGARVQIEQGSIAAPAR